MPLADLERVVASTRRAAARAGVPIVTGDTKVVPRGKGDGIFINTSGVGVVPAGLRAVERRASRAGDAVIVSGTIGDHGIAILSRARGHRVRRRAGERHRAARHGWSPPCSPPAPTCTPCATRRAAASPRRWSRSPRAAGSASTSTSGALPVRDGVRGACEMLGLDPLLVANEGKLVAFVAEAGADAVLAAMRAHPLGADAAVIGRVVDAHPGTVLARTAIGGERVIDLPFGEALPRIC